MDLLDFFIVKVVFFYWEFKLKRYVNGIVGCLLNSLNMIYIFNDYYNDWLFYFGDGIYIRLLFY